MWIQVRTMDGKKQARIDGLSKLTKIEDLREKLVEHFDAVPERQRLFYRGKQLEDGYSLFDYSVGLNEMLQIMIRPIIAMTPLQTKETNNNEDVGSHVKSGGSDDEASSDKENKPEPESQEQASKGDIEDIQEVNSTSQNEAVESTSDEETIETLHSEFKVGDVVDIRDPEMGCWFEADILKITKSTEDELKSFEPSDSTTKTNLKSADNNVEQNTKQESSENKDQSSVEMDTRETSGTLDNKDNVDVVKLQCSRKLDGFTYHIKYEGYEDDPEVKVSNINIRPRARTKIPLKDVNIGDRVMVNYNYDDCDTRGYWYDAIVTHRRETRTIKELDCTVFIGKDLIPMKNCRVLFWWEIFRIEEPGTQMNSNNPGSVSPVKRTCKPECEFCKDKESRKCKQCACCLCGDKKDPNKSIICDECEKIYHIYCLQPPLPGIPEEDEWYCPDCFNDTNEVVRAGEKLKESKKKSKMASASSTSNRDWGRGMACVGRTKQCTVVAQNHMGPIPGVEVGTQWKFRIQASEAGVHRPHVAGIHGREEEGAYSLVLSGGYEDDVDNADEFTYTGSGGRDLSGNKRTAEQSCDQTLTRMNMALARNCNAKVDKKNGAEADDWRGGKPVRVVRNCKLSKHSKYAPEEGNRYDGIYKVVKYWPEAGKSGFIVWRYLLRRDDESPAPWTKAGKKRIKELGLSIQYPPGYLEAQEEKEKLKEKKKAGEKRKKNDSDEENSPVKKKTKTTAYKLDKEVSQLVKEDKNNTKIWQEAMECTKEGAQVFLEKVESLFMCICCQDLAFKPITTKCNHNICKPCLRRSFNAEVYCCPHCRTDLGKDYSMAMNKTLSTILNKLFPGYENGR